jgi:hypothetical protein
MVTLNQELVFGSRPVEDYPSLKSFLDAQEEMFVESMQEAADFHWNMLTDTMPYEFREDIGEEMERWWDDHIRRFRSRLLEDYRRHQQRLLKRRVRRETRRRIAAEGRIADMELELQRTRDSLEGQRELNSYLKEQKRCPNCDSSLFM